MGVVNLSSQNQGNIMARATWLDTRARKVDVKGKQRRKPGFLSVSVVRQEGWLEQLACVWASYLHESYPDQPPKQTGNGTAQWKPGKWLLPSTLEFPGMLNRRMWRWLSWQSACLESTETGTGSPEPMWEIWARWHAPIIPAQEEVGTGGCLVCQPSIQVPGLLKTQS